MSSFLFISLQIISVFIGIAIGYLTKRIRKNKIDNHTLSEIIIYIGSPCLAFSKLARTNYSASELTQLTLAMLFLMAAGAALTWLISKVLNQKFTNIFYISTMFMNTANIGFPVTLFIFGIAGFQKAIILDLVMALVLFSLGIGLASKKYNEWLKIPLFYAAALGLIFSILKLPVPNIIFRPIELIGDIAVPLMLISLGSKLAEIKKLTGWKTALSATLIRSVGGFSLGLIFVYLFKLTGLTKNVVLLYSALPAPVMTYVLAQKYRQQETLAAEIVLVSNLAAIIILPVVIYLINFVV